MSIQYTQKTFNICDGASISPAPKQLQFWERPSIDPTTRLKAAMKEALLGCSLSREKVVSDMNTLAAAEGITCNGNGQKVTEALLDKWCAPGSTAYVIPTRYLPLFCRAVGSILPLQALAGPLGVEVITPEDMKLLAWARIETARRKLGKDARRLAQEVGIE